MSRSKAFSARHSMPPIDIPKRGSPFDAIPPHLGLPSSYSSPTCVFELSPADLDTADDDYFTSSREPSVSDNEPFLYIPPPTFPLSSRKREVERTRTRSKTTSHRTAPPTPAAAFPRGRPLVRPILAPSPRAPASDVSSTSSSRPASPVSPSTALHLTAAIKITGFRVDDRIPIHDASVPSPPIKRPQLTPSSRRPSFSASEWALNLSPGKESKGPSPPDDSIVDFNTCLLQRLARKTPRPQPVFI